MSARLSALGRLTRISLATTAAADVVAGAVLGAGGWPGGAHTALLVAASLGVYHGGMALNDWADRDEDASTRPERPLPAGEIGPGLALWIAVALLGGGTLLALLVQTRAGLLLGAAALGAVAYDLRGRGPWIGPLLLAACRGLNLASGVALGLAAAPPLRAESAGYATWLAPLLYGLYVAGVSRLGRLEDAPSPPGERGSEGHPRRILIVLALLLTGPAWIPLARGGAPSWISLAIGVAGSAGLVAEVARPGPWTHGRVLRSMGAALRRLLFFTAAVAAVPATASARTAALLILAVGFPLSFFLRRRFPPS